MLEELMKEFRNIHEVALRGDCNDLAKSSLAFTFRVGPTILRHITSS